MAEVIERVDALEAALMKLAYAQFNTEMELQKLSKEMTAFKDEMSEFKNEMSEFKNEMTVFKDEMADFKDEMADFKDEMSGFKNEMADFKDEMSEFKNETRQANREMNKRWGEISNKLGTIVEDIVYPNIARLAEEHFGAAEMEFIGARIKRRRAGAGGDLREFDVIAAWEGTLLLVEAKATLRPEYLKDYADFVRDQRVFDYFPEYRGRRLIPVFSSLSVPPTDVAYLTGQRIYALGMGDDTMELLNAGELA